MNIINQDSKGEYHFHVAYVFWDTGNRHYGFGTAAVGVSWLQPNAQDIIDLANLLIKEGGMSKCVILSWQPILPPTL